MELFNKYKNKNFAFITNYINSCLNDDSLALTEDELREQLSGASQSSFEEFLLALTNAYDNSESYNADILYRHDDFMIPLRQIPIPVRASLTEKAWLYYILQNSKSETWAVIPIGVGMALTAAWNGAPALCHGATIKPEKANPALQAANGRAFLGSSQGDNGARGAMRISHRATLSFSIGI